MIARTPASDITHVRSVALAVTNLSRSEAFYEELWGLEPVARERDRTFFGGSGPESFLLRLRAAHAKQLDFVSLGARDAHAVDGVAARLSAAAVTLIGAPTKIEAPGGGYGFGCFDPDGRRVEISSDVAPRDIRSVEPGVVRPDKISHIVINSANLERTVSFYVDLLGFRISDYIDDRMWLLRCQTEHHSIAVARAPHASMNHVAFDVRGIDEVMRGTGRLKRAGHAPVWGPGRHGSGNNVFSYFVDPDQFVVEYTCELEQIADEEAWQPKRWPVTASDSWGIGSPISAEARALMQGEPDPGLWKQEP